MQLLIIIIESQTRKITNWKISEYPIYIHIYLIYIKIKFSLQV